jgi:glycosyltransferase involved in cell wall biosynthesis
MAPADTKNTPKPLVSIIIPAYNEDALIEHNVTILYDYLDTLNDKYRWELLIVNDGSSDKTGELADALAEKHETLSVHHHTINRNLGTAMRNGFQNTKGDYVIVLDIDLSYAPEHIGRLLSKLVSCDAEMVIASPYMKGGKNTAVPKLRLILSKTVNFMMRKASGLNIYCFTSMVRAYKGDFVRAINTKSSTFDIMSELIFKTSILRGRIVEIPAHLDWSALRAAGPVRTSGLRIVKGIFNGLVNSFIFRPYIFFWFIGFSIFLVSLYVIGWIFFNTYLEYPMTAEIIQGFENRFSLAVSKVYEQRPYSFIVGGITLIVSIQIMGMGFLSLQKKRYFDELFHLNSAILKASKKSQNNSNS